uniref:HDC12632 n=1 Tax=Drosophila melanogaster TaxID=7227 RepID=Q6IKE8_DROME|nr:TPA_inf: HDC12632 [Drosophila melanogaster]
MPALWCLRNSAGDKLLKIGCKGKQSSGYLSMAVTRCSLAPHLTNQRGHATWLTMGNMRNDFAFLLGKRDSRLFSNSLGPKVVIITFKRRVPLNGAAKKTTALLSVYQNDDNDVYHHNNNDHRRLLAAGAALEGPFSSKDIGDKDSFMELTWIKKARLTGSEGSKNEWFTAV